MVGIPPLVPASFEVPRLVETQSFDLVPLEWRHAFRDFEAYSSSVEHLQSTFDLNTGSLRIGPEKWPAKVDLDTAFIDAAWSQFENFFLHSSFTFSAVDKTHTRQLGCGYISWSNKVGYHVECQTWVRADCLSAGFDDSFYNWFRNWVEQSWPFDADEIGWPGRTIPWTEWNQLPDLLRTNHMSDST